VETYIIEREKMGINKYKAAQTTHNGTVFRSSRLWLRPSVWHIMCNLLRLIVRYAAFWATVSENIFKNLLT
jgi:hypothetical protein